MTGEFDTYVLGGLPVTIAYEVQRAEPDVGIMSAYVDEWYFKYMAGRPIRGSDTGAWVLKRLDRRGEEEIIQACIDDYNDRRRGHEA